jgi:hypothetical protein
MKYFTPELLGRLGSSDEATFKIADTEWDRRLEAYEQHLGLLEPSLPKHIREFNDLLLHDARVHGIARQGNQFIVILRKDVPPCDLVLLTYTLNAEPRIDRQALPPEERSPVMDYLYNEFDMVRDGPTTCYTEDILFSNGWEIGLSFRDVQVTLAQTLYEQANVLTQSTASSAKSA